jgi:hypothetical protein
MPSRGKKPTILADPKMVGTGTLLAEDDAMRLLLLSAVALLGTFGCTAEAVEEEADEALEAQGSAALPLRGDFVLKRWKGHAVEGYYGSSVQTNVPVERTFTGTEPGGRVRFDLKPGGDGRITALKGCEIKILGPEDVASPPSKNPVQAVVKALTPVFQLAWNAYQCSKGPRETTVFAFQRRGFFGGPNDQLWANAGVFGEKPQKSANEECKRLWGVRYVDVGQSAVCIGFADPQAKTVRMLVQRPREIYVQRLDLERVSWQ